MNGKEAAKRLGCSEKSISRYVAQKNEAKRLHATRQADGTLEITDEQLDDFKARLEAQSQVAPRAPEPPDTGQDTADSTALVPVRSSVVRAQPKQSGLTLESLALAVVAIGEHVGAQDRQTGQDKPNVSITDLAHMPFLSFNQAHRLFNVPEQHLRDAARAGELKAIKQGRGQQVRAEDVRAWRNAKFENS